MGVSDGAEEVVQGEGEDAGGEVFKLGVDFEADEVADDEERRVFQGFVVLIELLIGLLEVFDPWICTPRRRSRASRRRRGRVRRCRLW